MKILHVINSLDQGGAESTLTALVKESNNINHIIVSLKDYGVYGETLRCAGVKIYPLRLNKINFFNRVISLYFIIRKEKPDIIQSWLYISDLIVSIVVCFLKGHPLVWNVRNGSLDTRIVSRGSVFSAKLCSIISKTSIPSGIISCSKSAIETHIKYGYQRNKFNLIYNGINVRKFTISPFSKREKVYIGYVGRFDPQKGHENLFEALALLRKKFNDFKIILAGQNILKTNEGLFRLIEKYDLGNFIELRGMVQEMEKLYSEIHIHVLPSLSEGFPNVVAESMSCGIPNIVTDVGDAANIVGNTGWVCKKGNPIDLCESIFSSINELNSEPEIFSKRREACRIRIVNEFSIEKMVNSYNQIWNKYVRNSRNS